MADILNQSYGYVKYIEDKGYLKLAFIGSIKEDEYQNLWNSLLDGAIQYPTTKILIDQSAIGAVSMMSRAWMLLKWLPKVKSKLPLRFSIAVITSSGIIHRTGAQYIQAGVSKLVDYDIKMVGNETDALNALFPVKET